MISIIMHRSWD